MGESYITENHINNIMEIGKKNDKFNLPDRYVVHSDDLNIKSKENDTEALNGWKNLHSPSWCPVPFNTISWHPSGVVSRCMMNDTPMGSSHESEQMQFLRKNMLEGKWDTHGCMNCLQKEQHGYKSQRINWLSNSMRHKRLGDPEPYTNPKLTENKITHLFVNFSNLCNFKCRMCSSKFSNSLIPENRHMTPLFPKLYKQVHGNREKNFNNINEYLEANPEILKDIRSIWMTGGEPFMTEDPYKLMKLLEQHGQPDKVNMTITTNGSKIDFDRLDEFNKLGKLSIDISIDAYGPLFEYMRSNGVFTWDQMKETCDKLAEYKSENEWFGIQINASYQMFNYNNMYDFIDFVSTYDVDSNIRLLTFPKHFRVGNLPDTYKQEALAMCDKIEKDFDTDKHRHLIVMLGDMRKAIESEENHLEDFMAIVKEQDKFREKYLYEYNKTLSEIIYKT